MEAQLPPLQLRVDLFLDEQRRLHLHGKPFQVPLPLLVLKQILVGLTLYECIPTVGNNNLG